MPQRGYLVGDAVLVRAELLAHGGDYCQVRIYGDDLKMVITTWAPTSEIIKAADLAKLRPRKKCDGAEDR